MAILNVYLYFNGNCEKAFDFYKSVFGGEYQYIGRYMDISQKDRQNFPNCSDEQIMHVALPISKETVLMGADLIDSNVETTKLRNGFSLHVSTDNRDEATHLFNTLAERGHVIVPIADQFWGSYYGLCTDKFGISWKINFDLSKNK